MRENGKDDSRYGKDYRPETLMDAIGEVDDKLLAEADAWRSERMARAEAADAENAAEAVNAAEAAEAASFEAHAEDRRRAREAGGSKARSTGRGRQKSPWNRYAVPVLTLAACVALVFVAQRVGIIRPLFQGAGSSAPSEQLSSAAAPAAEEAKAEHVEVAEEAVEEAAGSASMLGMTASETADAGGAENAAAETESYDMAEAEYAAEEAVEEAAPAAEMPMTDAAQSAADEREAASAKSAKSAKESGETAVVTIDAMDIDYRKVELTEKEQKELEDVMGDKIAENGSGTWYMTIVMHGDTKLQTAEQLILRSADGQLTLWEIAD